MKETTPAQRLRPFKLAEETALPQHPTNILVPPPLFSCSSFSSSSSFPSGSSVYSSASCLHSCVSSALPSSSPSSHPFSTSFPCASSSNFDTSVSFLSSSSFPSSSAAVRAASSCGSSATARGGETESASTATAAGEEWEEHPLFMTSMPTGEAFQRNPLLAALAAVIDEEEQLPFKAQRRRGIEGRRRQEEERDDRELTKTITHRNADFLFSTGDTTEKDTCDTGLISAYETKSIPAFDGRTATTTAEASNKERKSTQPTTTAATLSRHRSSCMPYAASSLTPHEKQESRPGRCEDSAKAITATGCPVPLQGTTSEPQVEPQRNEASPSIGELHICMKMWNMGK